MNFEVIKTYLLIILVLMSLFLTFALWNYKPNLELLSSDDSMFANEVDLGGKEEMKRTLIEPRMIMFHHNKHYYGLKTPLETRKLYHNMQEWILKDFQAGAVVENEIDDYQVEIIFANALPIEIIRSLFTINEEDTLPNWSFQQMFISFNDTTSTLDVTFLSIDGHQQVKYVVNDRKAYAHLSSYIEKPDELSEYILFSSGSGDIPIYLPEDQSEVKSRSLAVKKINAVLLIDHLFRTPPLVNTNTMESYFTDGQRRMSVPQEGRSLEFINPIHSNEKRTDVLELLDLSIEDINLHKGWTNDYKLADIDMREDLVRYRMFYDGYPVYNNNDLSIIEQQWRNQDLHLYRRPLFSANILLGGNTVKLASGTEVINYLMQHEKYQLSNIKDIQVGYKLTFFEGTSYDLTLEPAWYMNYNGNWYEVRLDDYMRGGS